MTKRTSQYRPGIAAFVRAGLLVAIVFGAIEIAGAWSPGTGSANQHNPVGQLARYVASQFTSAPSLVRAGSDRDELTVTLFRAARALLVLLFIALLWLRTSLSIKRPAVLDTGLLAAQMLLSIALDSLLLGVVVTAQLAVLLPLRQGLAWLAVHYLLGVGLDVYLVLDKGLGLNDAKAGTVLAYLGFERIIHGVGFALAYLARNEHRGRLALAAANAELLATQSLLADTVRASERTRIARDLHDVVGHHLTALSLHLDLALRQADGKPSESLRTSRELARALLDEVRTVVSTERLEDGIKLREALHTLCSGIPAPAIRLTVADDVAIASPAAAHTLFRCVQEALTNAVRHARADLLTIDIALRNGEVVVSIADDGKGCAQAAEGNGLAGMRERVARQGGVLTAGNLPLRGFGLEIRLPSHGAAA